MSDTKSIAVPASQAAAPVSEQLSPINTLRGVLEKMKAQIQLALPKHVSPDRMLRIVLTTVQRTPKLLECTRESLLGCIVQCAQLGLEPDGLLGHAYLIPFYNNKERRMECQLIVGYKGLLKLARQSGEISSISARVVHEKDVFEFEYGLQEKLRHIPSMDEDPGPLQFAYAIFRLKDGATHFDVMGHREIVAIQKRSKSGSNGPWVTDFEEMAKKTVLRRASKMSPASIEDRLARAISIDDRADAGLPQNIDEPIAVGGDQGAPAIEGEHEPVPELAAVKPGLTDLAAQARAKREGGPAPGATPAGDPLARASAPVDDEDEKNRRAAAPSDDETPPLGKGRKS